MPFHEKHQSDVNTMMDRIASEFEEPIFTAQSKKIVDVFRLPDNQFWIATDDDKVIGTIGMVQLKDQNIVLKSMFVEKNYRGQGVSQSLLDKLTHWARQNHYKQIYLGTMLQFISGQRFYEKNGFVKCTQEELPEDFITNALDTIFYTKNLIP